MRQAKKKGSDDNGRVVWIVGKIRSKTLLIIGVYGPPPRG